MKITMTNEVVKETLGDVYYIGSEIKREYDANLPEEERAIKSITVSVATDKFDKSIEIKLNKDEKTGLFNIPNAKKLVKISFDGLVYDPRSVANKMEINDQTNVWGSLEERFFANKIEAINKADRVANENGERV